MELKIKNEFVRLCLLSLIENRIDECYELLNKTEKEIYKKEMQVLHELVVQLNAENNN